MDFEPEVITLPWNDKLDSRYYIILLSCIPCIGVGAMTKADWPRKHHIAYHIIFSGGSVVYTYNVENCYVMLIPWFPKTNSPKPTATTRNCACCQISSRWSNSKSKAAARMLLRMNAFDMAHFPAKQSATENGRIGLKTRSISETMHHSLAGMYPRWVGPFGILGMK